MPIHDQGYRRYGGTRAPRRPRLAGHRARRHPHAARASARSSACCCSRGCRSSSAPCRSTPPPTPAGRSFLRADGARRSASSSSSRSIFVFFITVYVGAGLIANDRRANALQIYLSKPLTRAEYIVGKLAMLLDVPAARHLGAGDAAAGRCRCCSPAASRSSANNLFLFPAITRASLRPGARCRRSRCWRCRRCRRAAATSAILYAGADLLHRRRSTACCAPITGSTRVVVAVDLGATSTQVGDAIFRLPPRYDDAVAGLAAGRSSC